MAKRTLTRDEQILWRLYTNDVDQTSDVVEFAELQSQTARFDIKIPQKKPFKQSPKPTVSNYESLKNKDNNWYKYNDNIVSSMSEEEVVSSFAYCLFYAKK